MQAPVKSKHFRVDVISTLGAFYAAVFGELWICGYCFSSTSARARFDIRYEGQAEVYAFTYARLDPQVVSFRASAGACML